MCAKILCVSRDRPYSRRDDNSRNEIARPSLAWRLETTAPVAFIQEELEQRLLIGETGFEGEILPGCFALMATHGDGQVVRHGWTPSLDLGATAWPEALA